MSMISFRKRNKLLEEASRVHILPDGFGSPENGERRIARIGDSGEHMIVRNFPLPDGYRPDYIDLLILLDDFPARPPIGIYVLHKHKRCADRTAFQPFQCISRQGLSQRSGDPQFHLDLLQLCGQCIALSQRCS